MKHNYPAALAAAVGMALAIVSANAYAALFSHSRVDLPDDILNAHKSDLDGLYQAWLTPLTKAGDIPSSRADVMKDQAAIVKGFERFCSASDGRSAMKSLEFGTNLSCVSPGRADGRKLPNNDVAARSDGVDR